MQLLWQDSYWPLFSRWEKLTPMSCFFDFLAAWKCTGLWRVHNGVQGVVGSESSFIFKWFKDMEVFLGLDFQIFCFKLFWNMKAKRKKKIQFWTQTTQSCSKLCRLSYCGIFEFFFLCWTSVVIWKVILKHKFQQGNSLWGTLNRCENCQEPSPVVGRPKQRM